jgi:hypothetical protein
MKIPQAPVTGTHLGSSHIASKHTAPVRDSGSSTFEELLVVARGNSSEGKEGNKAKRTPHDRDRQDTADSRLQDAQRFMATQAPQIPAAQPPPPAPATGEFGDAPTDFDTTSARGTEGMANGAATTGTADESASPAGSRGMAADASEPNGSSSEAHTATSTALVGTDAATQQVNSDSPGPNRDRQDTADSRLQDAQRFMATQAPQIPAAQPPPPTPATGEFGDAPTDFDTTSARGTEGMANGAATTGTADESASPAGSRGMAADPSEPNGSSSEAHTATSTALVGTDAATQQVNSDSPGPNPSAKSSTATDVTPQILAAEKTNFPLNSNEITAAAVDGTLVARERRAMPEHLNEPHLKPNPTTDSSIGDIVNGTKLSSAQEKLAVLRRSEPEQSTVPVSSAPTTSLLEIHGQPAAPGILPGGNESTGTAELHSVGQIIGHTMELAERVNLKGGNYAEVQMRLPDGKEVTVSLHLTNGEWKPVFKTDTEALSRALEQGWQQTGAQSPARTVRFGTPVFESAQSHTGLSGGTDQQPDAQKRSFTRREEDSFFSTVPSRNRRSSAPMYPAHLPVSNTVRLYA